MMKKEMTNETEFTQMEKENGMEPDNSPLHDTQDAARDEGGQGEIGMETDSDTLIIEQQKRIAELEQQVEELRDTLLRRAAELDNIRKRVQRERIQMNEAARVKAVESFLPVNDDLQRTLQVLDSPAGSDQKGIEEGIRMIAAKFDEVLRQHGVERIDQTGVPFDVDLHDALMRQKPLEEGVESNTVLQIVENGYRMDGKTIRHAKVIVSE